MLKIISILFLVICSSTFANDEVDFQFSGNLDLLSKQMQNPDSAINNTQSWNKKNESMNIASANISSFISYKEHSIDANWFLRYSKSELYRDDHYANQYAIFQNDPLARDVLKMSKSEYGEDTYTESVLNRFEYTMGDEEFKFKIGRLWIQYGDGLVFNPINPYNIPMTFSPLTQINQGNDGMEFQFLSDPRLKIYLYVLGDKEIYDNDEGRIGRTIMIRGDYDYSEKMNINYIVGEDQKRHKYGFELKYSLASGFILGQFVKESRRQDKSEDASEGLTHYILAFEKDLTSIWSIRLEGGKNDQDKFNSAGTLYPRYQLPLGNYAALLSNISISDKWQLQLNLVQDPKTKFTYAGTSLSRSLSKHLELRAFASSVIAKDEQESKEHSEVNQIYIPSDFGLMLTSKF